MRVLYSALNILMGEHFSASKERGKAPFLPQHWMAWLGVWVMSWSMNCPICMTRMVLSPSALLSPTERALLMARAEGSSTLPALLLRGRSRLNWKYYSIITILQISKETIEI